MSVTLQTDPTVQVNTREDAVLQSVAPAAFRDGYCLSRETLLQPEC